MFDPDWLAEPSSWSHIGLSIFVVEYATRSISLTMKSPVIDLKNQELKIFLILLQPLKNQQNTKQFKFDQLHFPKVAQILNITKLKNFGSKCDFKYHNIFFSTETKSRNGTFNNYNSKVA